MHINSEDQKKTSCPLSLEFSPFSSGFCDDRVWRRRRSREGEIKEKVLVFSLSSGSKVKCCCFYKLGYLKLFWVLISCEKSWVLLRRWRPLGCRFCCWLWWVPLWFSLLSPATALSQVCIWGPFFFPSLFCFIIFQTHGFVRSILMRRKVGKVKVETLILPCFLYIQNFKKKLVFWGVSDCCGMIYFYKMILFFVSVWLCCR